MAFSGLHPYEEGNKRAGTQRSHFLWVRIVVNEAREHEARHDEKDHAKGIFLDVVGVLVGVLHQIYDGEGGG